MIHRNMFTCWLTSGTRAPVEGEPDYPRAILFQEIPSPLSSFRNSKYATGFVPCPQADHHTRLFKYDAVDTDLLSLLLLLLFLLLLSSFNGRVYFPCMAPNLLDPIVCNGQFPCLVPVGGVHVVVDIPPRHTPARYVIVCIVCLPSLLILS